MTDEQFDWLRDKLRGINFEEFYSVKVGTLVVLLSQLRSWKDEAKFQEKKRYQMRDEVLAEIKQAAKECIEMCPNTVDALLELINKKRREV